MLALDFLTPWITFAAILIPLRVMEHWIHQHLYGVGWLLTRDKERATILYYLVFLPGVFLHEFSQWLLAGALGVKTSKIKTWPKAQKNGTLRYDFVKVSTKKVTRLQITIIDLVPVLVGIGVVLFISQNIFDVSTIPAAFASGDLVLVRQELSRLFATPDFWLWQYMLFAIGNAMLPTQSTQRNWPLFLGIFGGISAFLMVIGLGEEVLIPALEGPITRILNTLVTAFGTVFVVDAIMVIVLGTLERLLEGLTGEQAKYPRPRKTKTTKPEPGGEIPMENPPLRMNERRLPIPPPPKRERKPKPEPVSPTPSYTQQELSSRTAHDSPSYSAYSADTAEAEEDTTPAETAEPFTGGTSPAYSTSRYTSGYGHSSSYTEDADTGKDESADETDSPYSSRYSSSYETPPAADDDSAAEDEELTYEDFDDYSAGESADELQDDDIDPDDELRYEAFDDFA
jgi:hypothetical protein